MRADIYLAIEWLSKILDYMVKKISANGGCLGSKRRRRTCYSAISSGELKKGVESEISEWGNPITAR